MATTMANNFIAPHHEPEGGAVLHGAPSEQAASQVQLRIEGESQNGQIKK